MQAEARLRDLLAIAPTDGEAQLLHASVLRRTGRTAEARKALDKLARSDSGAPWRHEIATELARLSGPARDSAAEEPVVLPLRDESDRQGSQSAAA